MARRWIQRATARHRGALRQTVRRMYGVAGFTRAGTIRVSVLRSLAAHARSRTTRKRARLALKLREF